MVYKFSDSLYQIRDEGHFRMANASTPEELGKDYIETAENGFGFGKLDFSKFYPPRNECDKGLPPGDDPKRLPASRTNPERRAIERAIKSTGTKTLGGLILENLA